MAKKPISKKKLNYNHHTVLVLTCIALVVVLVIGFVLLFVVPKINNQERLNRINAIFASVKIDDKKCYESYSNVFGNKKLYDWDKGRSFSSQVNYECGYTVSDSVAMIKKLVAGTNFTFYQEPYPGSTSWEYIYKSPKNEYLRISVSSKLRDDAFHNDFWMTGGTSAATFAIDPNAGPSTITIKVNLDDNNE